MIPLEMLSKSWLLNGDCGGRNLEIDQVLVIRFLVDLLFKLVQECSVFVMITRCSFGNVFKIY